MAVLTESFNLFHQEEVTEKGGKLHFDVAHSRDSCSLSTLAIKVAQDAASGQTLSG